MNQWTEPNLKIHRKALQWSELNTKTFDVRIIFKIMITSNNRETKVVKFKCIIMRWIRLSHKVTIELADIEKKV